MFYFTYSVTFWDFFNELVMDQIAKTFKKVPDFRNTPVRSEMLRTLLNIFYS